MVDIYPIVFKKEDLPAEAREEALFHLVFAQMTNEILILRKQMMLAANSVAEPGAATDAAVAVAHVNLRLLAGRLFEGYQLLRTKPAGRLHRTLSAQLDREALDAHKAIMRYFGNGSSLIEKLRNKASFHWDHDTLSTAFDFIPDDQPLTDYVSAERGNSLYYSGSLLSDYQVAVVAGLRNVGEALDQAHDEVTQIAVLFEDYANAFMFEFSIKYLALSSERFRTIEQTLTSCPDIQAATMPYFLDTDSLKRRRLPE